MREIKFRVWGVQERTFLKNNSRMGLYVNSKLCHGGDYGNRWYIPQQWTGLKDVNGVDIYEGDTIQHFAFDDGDLFTIAWDKKNGCWSCYGVFSELSRCKVVGNIMENEDGH